MTECWLVRPAVTADEDDEQQQQLLAVMEGLIDMHMTPQALMKVTHSLIHSLTHSLTHSRVGAKYI